MMQALDDVRFDERGLVPVVTQDAASGRVLMLAWANREALQETLSTGRGVYFSRSRQKLWRKGEESGNVQLVKEVRLDCDGDAVLYRVEQVGGMACHTGRQSCFYRRWENGAWKVVDPVLKDPNQMYHHTPSAPEPVTPQPGAPLTFVHPCYRKLVPEQAQKVLERGGALLIDVREPQEFAAGHVQGALNIPLSLLRSGTFHVPVKWLDQPIFVQCRSGVRSEAAARILIEEGCTNVVNIYGTLQWPYGLVK